MLKLKRILPVFVVLLFLGIASTAFGQVSCSVSSTPVSRDTATGLTEPAGDITFTCTQTGGATSTAGATITVDYQGTPITNCQAGGTQTNCPAGGYPAAKPIAITPVQASAVPAGVCSQPTIGATGVSNSTGQIVITVPGTLAGGAGASCSFTLTGVLFALSGTGKTSVQATVSVSPGNNLAITAGQTTPTVVTSVLDGVVAAGFKATPGSVLTNGTIITAGSTITIKENYIDMYRATAQFNSGAATQGVQLSLVFAGIPTGSTVTCAAPTLDNGGTVSVTPATGVATSAAPTLTLEITLASLTTLDTVTVPCTYGAGTSVPPLAPGSITATVTLAPNGTAFGTAGALNTSAAAGQIPRYTSLVLGPVTVYNIIATTTHILLPFVSVGNGFDTGFVIANTTADPYGTAVGAGGAKPVSGPVTIAFYANDGTTPVFCGSTGAGAATVVGATCATVTAGIGLSSGGVVASGSSWEALGSQVFAQITGAPKVFNGYAFVIANFSHGHATAFVADATFSGKFSSGGPMLVLPNPASTSRTAALGAGLVESLSH